MGAASSGNPGWPLFASCTASTARNRTALTHSKSSAGSETGAFIWQFLGDETSGGQLAPWRRGQVRDDCSSCSRMAPCVDQHSLYDTEQIGPAIARSVVPVQCCQLRCSTVQSGCELFRTYWHCIGSIWTRQYRRFVAVGPMSLST